MKDTKMTIEQQLDLISNTINNSNALTKRNSGTPLLIWGYTMITMLLIQIIFQFNIEGDFKHYALTSIPIFLTPLIAWILSKIIIKDQAVTPSNSKNLRKLWMIIGIVTLLVMLTTSNLFTMAWLLAIGVVATGVIMKEPCVTSCGIAGLITSILLPFFTLFIKPRLFSPETWTEKIDMGFFSITPLGISLISPNVIMIIVLAILFIVPGHMLNHKYNKSQNVCSKS